MPATQPTATAELPEGILRSSFLPEDCLAATALFLLYEKGWYIVGTRWQNLKHRRRLEDALINGIGKTSQ